MSKGKDITGQKFGKLTAIEILTNMKKEKRRKFKMSIENQEMDLIKNLVGKKFKSERAFYNGVLTQNSWTRLKNGESNLWNVALKSYKRMMDRLFTPYEQYLLQLAKQQVQLNLESDLAEAFHKLKMQHAKYMVRNDAQISVNSAFETFPGDERENLGTVLKVEDELGNYITFTINIPSHQVPSGRRNRREWFEENFEKVVVL